MSSSLFFLPCSQGQSLYSEAEKDGTTVALLHRNFTGLQSKEKVYLLWHLFPQWMSEECTKKVNTIISFVDGETVSVATANREAVSPYRRCLEPAL